MQRLECKHAAHAVGLYPRSPDVFEKISHLGIIGNYIISLCSDSQRLRVWDQTTGTCLKEIHGAGYMGSMMVAGSNIILTQSYRLGYRRLNHLYQLPVSYILSLEGNIISFKSITEQCQHIEPPQPASSISLGTSI